MKNKFLLYVVASVGFFVFGVILPIILLISGYFIRMAHSEYRKKVEDEAYARKHNLKVK